MRNTNERNKKIKRTRPPARKPKQAPRSAQPSNREYAAATYYSRPDRPSQQPTQTRQAPPRSAPPRRRGKKKKPKFFVGRLLFLIGFIIVVIYLISIVLETTQRPVISYQTVQTGIIDNSDVFKGLIVRDEKLVMNAEEGNMYLIAREGDKIKRDGMIYQILDPSEISVLERNIQNVESDIEKVQAKRQGISYLQNEIQAINNDINTTMEIYYMQAKPGDMQATHALKKQLEQDIAKRKSVHLKDNAAALNELKSEREVLATQLSGSEVIYKASEPGIVSYYTDGVEAKFTLDQLDHITQKDVEEKYPSKSTIANQIIGPNEPAYRLIKDNTWKVVCFVPEDWAERFKPGQKHEFVLIDDQNVEFTLQVEENIPQEKNHKIIFRSNEQLDTFARTRTISFKSMQYIYEGLKIPSSAVTERNQMKIPSDYIISSEDGKGVMKTAGVTGQGMFQKLDIQYADDQGYTHVLQNIGENQGLKLGGIISHPSNPEKLHTVSEVSTIKGVYAVNGRITRFKAIDIIAQNAEHLIVKSKAVNGLKQFDQIVTNPKNIQAEELLRNMDVKNIN